MIRLSNTLILIILVSCSYGQTYMDEMASLINSNKYREAFNFGNSKIDDLKRAKKRNYYIEFLTWACLAMHPNQNYRKEGCAVMKDYLSLNENFFSKNKALDDAKALSDNICLRNKSVKITSPFTQKSEIELMHIKDRSGAKADMHFKNYILLKKEASYESFFSKLSQEDFDRISTLNLSEGLLYTFKDDSTFKTDMRTFEVSGIELIAPYVKKIYNSANWYKSKNFVVVSTTKKENDLKITATALERVLAYYNKELGLPANTELIFIYLSEDVRSINNYIKKLYNISAPYAVGFTDPGTRSIVAFIPENHLVGTLKHELIHVLYFNEFPFAPKWLEEGLASLYEESRFNSNNLLIGINNWRLKFLKALKPNILDSLFQGFLTGDQAKINVVYYDIHKQLNQIRDKAMLSRGHEFLKENLAKTTRDFTVSYTVFCKDAFLRYLLMFLQSSGKLKIVLDKVRRNGKQNFDDPKYIPFDDIFLEAIGVKDLAEASKKFSSWLSLQKS